MGLISSNDRTRPKENGAAIAGADSARRRLGEYAYSRPFRLENVVSHYRLYGLNSDGHFVRCAEFEAESDGEACGRSILLRGDGAAELWAGARFVTTFKAPDDAPVAA